MCIIADTARGDFISRKRSRRFLPVIAVALSFFLAGCETYYDAVNRNDFSNNNVTPPSVPPKIIYGQRAYVWYVYGSEDTAEVYSMPSKEEIEINLEVWRKTGLFSSVSKANSRTPPLDAVLIRRTCSTSGDRYPFLESSIMILTLGLIPRVANIDVYCDQEFYQNGKLIGKNLFGYTARIMTGWLGLTYKEQDTWKKESQMCANNLLSQIKRK